MRPTQYDFTKKTILITGGSTGIGFATAKRFLQSGANVVIAGRNRNAGNEAVKKLKITGQNIRFCQADISRSADVQRLVAQTIEIFGGLDVAFNNAGIEGNFAPILDIPDEEASELVDINLKGVWLSSKYELKHFAESKTPGVIINTSSWLAMGALPGSSIYSTSKAGLDGFIRALALEAAPYDVRVNNINPGYILTPMFSRFFDPESEDARPYLSHAPINRFGTAEEVAELVVWLASPSASFVNGQTIAVDGGLNIPGQRV